MASYRFPCERVSPPKQIKNIDDIKYFTLEQSQTFLKALDKEYTTKYKAYDRTDDTGQKYHVPEYTETRGIPLQFKVMYYIALFVGLRKGELVALTWNDVDFKNNTININKSTATIKGQQITKSQNKTSVRGVTIPGFVTELLKRYKTEQKELKVSLGDQRQGFEGKDWQDNNNIFIQWNGKQMNISTPYQTFKDIIHKYNSTVEDESLKIIPNIPLHGLRHTSATVLISEDVDIRTVSARLGHAQTSTTMNIYAHSLKESDKKAADKLDRLFSHNQITTVTK